MGNIVIKTISPSKIYAYHQFEKTSRIKDEEICSCVATLCRMIKSRERLEINVLCGRCGIDRVTFYRNYGSIKGFLKRVAEDLASRLAFLIRDYADPDNRSITRYTEVSYDSITEVVYIIDCAPSHFCELLLARYRNLWECLLAPLRLVVENDSSDSIAEQQEYLFSFLCDKITQEAPLWLMKSKDAERDDDLRRRTQRSIQHILLSYEYEKRLLQTRDYEYEKIDKTELATLGC